MEGGVTARKMVSGRRGSSPKPMRKRHSRNSLQLLIDNERQMSTLNLANNNNNNNNVYYADGPASAAGGLPGCGADFYFSDDENDEEGVFGPPRRPGQRRGTTDPAGARSAPTAAHLAARRDSYGNPVCFKRVAFYEHPGILMIVQSIGSEQQGADGGDVVYRCRSFFFSCVGL